MEPQISTQVAKTIVSEKTAPRVTEESIKAKIADVTYYVHDCLTVCIITMRNGFHFTGTAAPASEANFDYRVGERYAYDDAFKKIWTHEGYLLRERLMESALAG